jgi:hypothetical protein
MALDAVGARYGTRPSSLLRGSYDDLQLDYAVLVAARAHRETIQERQQQEAAQQPVDRSQFLSVRHLARPARVQ